MMIRPDWRAGFWGRIAGQNRDAGLPGMIAVPGRRATKSLGGAGQRPRAPVPMLAAKAVRQG